MDGLAEVIIQGSRREVKGIVTLDDAAKAIEALFGSEGGVPVDAPFHCYLDGTSFAIWTEAKPAEAVPAKTPIAYLMGSFWFCVPCAQEHYDLDELEAAYAGDTLAFYQYDCDHPGCSTVIQAKFTTEGDGLG